MKIGFLSALDFNLYLFRLSWMKEFLKRGDEVYAIIPKGNYCNKFISENIKVINYNINRRSINPYDALRTISQLYKIFKKEKFNVLHTFNIKPHLYGTIAGKLTNIPIIINYIEGRGYIYTFNSIKAKILRFLVNNIYYKLTTKFASKIVVLNIDDFNEISSFVRKDKITIIKGTGVDTKFFSKNNANLHIVEKLKNELKINDNHIVITTIARLLWSKGIKEFVDAANLLVKKYKNLIFLIAGWIDKDNPDAISEDFIKKCQNENIKFIGKREEIREILHVTDIYVLPSYYREGIPRIILEAMCMEKPIITTDAPGCKETVDNYINGIIIPTKNSKALADAIEKIIMDEDMREKMGKASREKVIKEFSNEIIIKKVLELQNSLCK